jgi:membrane protease YdiL (CAAX protease family)
MDFYRRHRSFALACIIESMLGLMAYVLGWILNQPLFRDLAWNLPDAALGAAASIPLFGLFWWTLRSSLKSLARIRRFLEEFVRPFFGQWALWQLALISLLAGLGEECLFRRLIQGGLTDCLGPALAIAIASGLFGGLHLVTRAYGVIATLVGIYLGTLYFLCGNLLTPIVAHALYDFAALIYFLRRQA